MNESCAVTVKVTGTPDSTTELASFATAVMLAVAEPSDGMVVRLELTDSVVNVPPVAPPPPSELPLNESPPHAASNNVNADKAAIEKNLRMIHPD